MIFTSMSPPILFESKVKNLSPLKDNQNYYSLQYQSEIGLNKQSHQYRIFLVTYSVPNIERLQLQLYRLDHNLWQITALRLNFEPKLQRIAAMFLGRSLGCYLGLFRYSLAHFVPSEIKTKVFCSTKIYKAKQIFRITVDSHAHYQSVLTCLITSEMLVLFGSASGYNFNSVA